MATLEERVQALEKLLSAAAGAEPYNSQHTGPQIDDAIARALPGGAIDITLQNKLGGVESADHPGCYYRMVGSVVEWFNPPMELGEEYRTTERYLGNPVYVKLVDCGRLPAQGTYKDFVFSSDVNSTISVTAYSPMRGTTLPYYDTNGVRYSITGHGASVTIWNYSESLLDTDVRALIKYTKTTD